MSWFKRLFRKRRILDQKVFDFESDNIQLLKALETYNGTIESFLNRNGIEPEDILSVTVSFSYTQGDNAEADSGSYAAKVFLSYWRKE